MEDEAYAIGLEFDDEVEKAHSREWRAYIKTLSESIIDISRGETARDIQTVTRGVSQNVREIDKQKV